MKFKLQIDEIVRFSHEVTVEAKNEIELDAILDELESKGSHPDDIIDYLNEENGINIINFIKDEDGKCEFECPDYSGLD